MTYWSLSLPIATGFFASIVALATEEDCEECPRTDTFVWLVMPAPPYTVTVTVTGGNDGVCPSGSAAFECPDKPCKWLADVRVVNNSGATVPWILIGGPGGDKVCTNVPNGASCIKVFNGTDQDYPAIVDACPLDHKEFPVKIAEDPTSIIEGRVQFVCGDCEPPGGP